MSNKQHYKKNQPLECTHRYDSANGLLAKNDRLSPESRRVLPKTNSNEAPTAKLLRLKRIMSKPGYNTKLYQPCFHPGEPCTWSCLERILISQLTRITVRLSITNIVQLYTRIIERPQNLNTNQYSNTTGTKENCPCVQNGVFCEKWCGCAPGCDKAFPGCKCRQGRCRTWCSSVAFFENVTSFSCFYYVTRMTKNITRINEAVCVEKLTRAFSLYLFLDTTLQHQNRYFCLYLLQCRS